ncbi:MAG: vWA domain-containing protein [Pseudomonadota bacterium]
MMFDLSKSILVGASALALLAGVEVANAQTKPLFHIEGRVPDDDQAILTLQRWLDFEAEVSLNLRTDPALVPSARVLEMVQSIAMVDEAGLQISRGYAIDVAHDLVVGYSGGSAEITRVHGNDQSLIVTALFKDAMGRIVVPPKGSLAAYTTGGDRLCLAEEIVTAEELAARPASSAADGSQASTSPLIAPEMSFALLIDRSGSMASVRSEVDRAARRFLDALPNTATCTVGGFATGFSFDSSDGYGQRSCRAQNFSLTGGRDIGGGTDLYSPLAKVYRDMNAPAIAAHQKAVLVITDGGLNGGLELKEQLLRLRGGVLTFVYFVGGSTDMHLRDLADHYLEHQGDLPSALERYFQVVSGAFAKQTILRVVPCDEF